MLLLKTYKKNIRKQCKNNKLEIIAPTWNDEFELADGSFSVSDIHDYTEYIIKKHEIVTAIPPIHIYINRINNRLVFKTKDGYKQESQMPEKIKLFGSTKALIGKTKNDETVPGLEVININKRQKSYRLILFLFAKC